MANASSPSLRHDMDGDRPAIIGQWVGGLVPVDAAPQRKSLPACHWCDRPSRRRRPGGRPQRFCRPNCRRQFHAAARRRTLDAIVAGGLTVGDIRKGFTATCALSPPTSGEVPIPSSGGSLNLLQQALAGVMLAHRCALPACRRSASIRQWVLNYCDDDDHRRHERTIRRADRGAFGGAEIKGGRANARLTEATPRGNSMHHA